MYDGTVEIEFSYNIFGSETKFSSSCRLIDNLKFLFHLKYAHGEDRILVLFRLRN